jgi:hypothetical protein
MPSESRTYNLRPNSRSEADSTLEGGCRVLMAVSDMRVEGVTPGDLICIQSESSQNRGIGIAWSATDALGSGHKSQGNPVIRVTEWFRSCCSFELKDRYLVTKWHGDFLIIKEITITNVTTDVEARKRNTCSREELEFWVPTALGKIQLQLLMTKRANYQ